MGTDASFMGTDASFMGTDASFMGTDASFMGTDAEGLPSQAFAGEDGTYHITGSLSVAPAPAVKKILSNCGFDRTAVQQG